MNPAAIQQLQRNLGLPATGVLDDATVKAMNTAVGHAVAADPTINTYAKGNTVDTILNAYTSGDWSGVIDLTGKPFTDEQQKAAVTAAESVLAPAYKETEALDRSVVEDSLRGTQGELKSSQVADAKQFGQDKDVLDQNSADRGVLFSGSRTQKLNDLRTSYQERERIARENASSTIRSTVRPYQYSYGNDAAKGLSDLYQLPGASTFNTNVAGGQVTPSKTLSGVYNPDEFKFQGTKPVAQKAAVQVRAASQLGNTANKLSLAGYGTKL